MKKFLLPEGANWYRANLHCHTNISDGRFTPEEVKAAYRSRGYSVVAYSDHERFVPHPELDDGDFLAFPSIECAIGIDNAPIQLPPGAGDEARQYACYHFNLFATRPDSTIAPLRRTIWGAQRNQFDGTETERLAMAAFSREKVADFLDACEEGGFLVQFNHPYWSLNSIEDCLALDKIWSLEILNWATQRETAAEYCPYIYDIMLRKHGPSLFCTMADDNHNPAAYSLEEHSFGGSTFFAAPKLSQAAIVDSMRRGDFFCASGVNPPRFHSLWVEDGKVHAEFSPVGEIVLTGYGRVFRQVRGAGITTATFDIPKGNPYFRLTLIDGAGNFANTHAYAAC